MSDAVTKLYDRAAALTDEGRNTGRTFVIKIRRSVDDLFRVESEQSSYDGQGDTIEAALTSFVAHIETGALRDAVDAEARAKRIRCALTGETP